MIVERYKEKIMQLRCDDDSDVFNVQRNCEGEPFRSGITIGMENNDFDKDVRVMLCDEEAIELRDYLLILYPRI